MKKSEVLAIAGARELRKGEMKSVGGGIALSSKCSDQCFTFPQDCYWMNSCLAPGLCSQSGICVPI